MSFAGVEEFLEKLRQKTPHKIDIGAVYTRPPCDRRKVGDFYPVERELIFDIDLTDYDAIRNCCSGADVCQKCWRWVVLTVKVLNKLLQENFGFEHILWVFSGRRGVHCWISDPVARTLPNIGREALTKYLTFDKSSVITMTHVHPMAEDAYRVILDSGEFDRLVIEQGWLETEEKWTKVLDQCCSSADEDDTLKQSLHSEFTRLASAELRWESLKYRFDEVSRAFAPKGIRERLPQMPDTFPARHFLRYFVLGYGYPRLDEKVSTVCNHLLKSPFSVHPKNGRIAVPLDPKTVDRFSVKKVPVLMELVEEMRRIQDFERNNFEEKNNANQKTISALLSGRKIFYSKTSLCPFIETFQAFVGRIAEAHQRDEGIENMSL